MTTPSTIRTALDAHNWTREQRGLPPVERLPEEIPVATETAPEMAIKALAPWFGGKRTLAPRIVAELGEHSAYWEPFGGGLSVLLNKPACREETVNDLHGDLVNLARVLAGDDWWELCDRVQRTMFCEDLFTEAKARLAESPADEVQRAYDYLVVSWMGLNGVAGTAQTNANLAVRYTSNGGDPAKRWRSVGESLPAWHERLLRVRILRRDAFTLLGRIEDKRGTVIYVDPPYVQKSAKYLFDFGSSEAEQVARHQELARTLGRFRHTRVVVSYYDDPLVRAAYAAWTIVPVEATKGLVSSGRRDQAGAIEAPEVLIVNGPAYTEKQR